MILIAIGANLPGPGGETPLETCRAALARFGDYGMRTKINSRWYGSPAYPAGAGPDFVNGVARVESRLGPEALLERLHALEAAFGRQRGRKNAPRRLDLDLLEYDGLVSDGPEPPILPHPRLTERAFVLYPLAEVAPGWRHPVDGRTIEELLRDLPAGQKAWVLETNEIKG